MDSGSRCAELESSSAVTSQSHISHQLVLRLSLNPGHVRFSVDLRCSQLLIQNLEQLYNQSAPGDLVLCTAWDL